MIVVAYCRREHPTLRRSVQRVLQEQTERQPGSACCGREWCSPLDMSVISETIGWVMVKFRRSSSKTARSIAILALLGAFALRTAWADSVPQAAQRHPVAPGLWGGEHVRMVVSSDGAELEYDCANGKIDQPILLDSKGGFNSLGSYTSERGGPRRNGDAALPRARYVGRVSGETMRLTVTLDNSKKTVGVFALTRGTDSLLTKCR